mgnify:FL=1
MALSKATLDAITAAVTAAIAAAPPVASGQAGGPSRSRDGRDYPCTAGGECTRVLRSAARAAVHGIDAGGHEARR